MALPDPAAAIAALPFGGVWDGGGQTYETDGIVITQSCTVQNATLLSNANRVDVPQGTFTVSGATMTIPAGVPSGLLVGMLCKSQAITQPAFISAIEGNDVTIEAGPGGDISGFSASFSYHFETSEVNAVIRLHNADNVTISGITMTGLYVAGSGFFSDMVGNSGINFTGNENNGCVVEHCSMANLFGDGITIFPANGLTVTDVTITDVGREGITPAAGFDMVFTDVTIINPEHNALDYESDVSTVGVGNLVWNNFTYDSGGIHMVEPLLGPQVFNNTNGNGNIWYFDGEKNYTTTFIGGTIALPGYGSGIDHWGAIYQKGGNLEFDGVTLTRQDDKIIDLPCWFLQAAKPTLGVTSTTQTTESADTFFTGTQSLFVHGIKNVPNEPGAIQIDLDSGETAQFTYQGTTGTNNQTYALTDVAYDLTYPGNGTGNIPTGAEVKLVLGTVPATLTLKDTTYVPPAGVTDSVSQVIIENSQPPPPPPEGPTVTNIVPSSAVPGTGVTISGTNFGSSPAVAFGSVSAPVALGNDTTLGVNVPQMPPGGTAVYVTTDAGTGIGLFEVEGLPPVLSDIEPSHALAGTLVTITGTNLGGTVTFGTAEAQVVASSATVMTVIVPEVPPGGYVVTDTTDSGSGTGLFQVIAPPPPPPPPHKPPKHPKPPQPPQPGEPSEPTQPGPSDQQDTNATGYTGRHGAVVDRDRIRLRYPRMSGGIETGVRSTAQVEAYKPPLRPGHVRVLRRVEIDRPGPESELPDFNRSFVRKRY